MNYDAQTWAYTLDLDKSSKSVLVALTYCAQADHQAWPSQSTLAAMTGQSTRQVIRALAILEGFNLIRRQARSEGLKRLSDMIILCVGADIPGVARLDLFKPKGDTVADSVPDTVSLIAPNVTPRHHPPQVTPRQGGTDRESHKLRTELLDSSSQNKSERRKAPATASAKPPQTVLDMTQPEPPKAGSKRSRFSPEETKIRDQIFPLAVRLLGEKDGPRLAGQALNFHPSQVVLNALQDIEQWASGSGRALIGPFRSSLQKFAAQAAAPIAKNNPRGVASPGSKFDLTKPIPREFNDEATAEMQERARQAGIGTPEAFAIKNQYTFVY